MNNRDVAKAWWKGSRPSGKGSNFWFDGATIYSYGQHFPIAVKHSGYTMLTTRRHSVSTSKHIGYVRCVVAGTVYHVDNVRPLGIADHYRNLEIMQGVIDTLRQKIKRARSYKDMYLRQIAEMESQREEYARRFAPEKGTPVINPRSVKVREVA